MRAGNAILNINFPNFNSFVFGPCEPTEVNKSGSNRIHTKIMQMISNIICVPLSKMYNSPTVTHHDKFKKW